MDEQGVTVDNQSSSNDVPNTANMEDEQQVVVTVNNTRKRDMDVSITTAASLRRLSSILRLAHSEDVAAQQRGMLELSTALRSKGPLNVSRVAAIVGPSDPTFVCVLHRSV